MLRASNVAPQWPGYYDKTGASRGSFLKRLFTDSCASPVANEVNVYRGEHPRVEARLNRTRVPRAPKDTQKGKKHAIAIDENDEVFSDDKIRNPSPIVGIIIQESTFIVYCFVSIRLTAEILAEFCHF